MVIMLQPKLITAQQDVEPFDIVLLSSKTYHLEQSIRRPFVGPNQSLSPYSMVLLILPHSNKHLVVNVFWVGYVSLKLR